MMPALTDGGTGENLNTRRVIAAVLEEKEEVSIGRGTSPFNRKKEREGVNLHQKPRESRKEAGEKQR